MTAASPVIHDRAGAQRVLRELPPPLVAAIGLSIGLHLALLVIGAGRIDLAGMSGREPRPLQAALVASPPAPSFEPLPLPAPLTMPSLRRETMTSLALPAVPPPPAPEPAPATSRGVASSGPGWGRAMGVVLTDRTRLGALDDRTRLEFPIEIDRPPRVLDRIVAQYPAGALAAGREDTVIAWVVVNEEGRASQIEVAEGAEDFADQVRAALRDARFRPAQDKLAPIRFPIALQFDFRLGAESSAAPAVR